MSKFITKLCLIALVGFSLNAFAEPPKDPRIESMVIFGDSMSDNGNLNHLLRSLRFEEDPGYLVSPLKEFVFNKMDDFAERFYVPASVLYQGKATVRHFFDDEVGPMIATLVGMIRTLPLIPEPPYWEHHFSDGKVWNEYLAEAANINTFDANHFTNKAFGGSWAMTYDYQLTTWNLIRHPIISLQNLIKGKLLPPSLGLAVQAHLLATRYFDTHATYFIFAGSNDYLNMLQFEDNYNPAKIEEYIEHSLDGIQYSTEQLIAAGAKKIVLMGVPDISRTPYYVDSMDKSILHNTIKDHNGRMHARITLLKESHPDVKFTYIDIASLMETLLNKPDDYGIKYLDKACIDIPLPAVAFTSESKAFPAFGKNVVLEYMQYTTAKVGNQVVSAVNECGNPGEYLFWDYVHPTAKVHKLLSKGICKALTDDGYKIDCPADNA